LKGKLRRDKILHKNLLQPGTLIGYRKSYDYRCILEDPMGAEASPDTQSYFLRPVKKSGSQIED